jgi:hypothetical protein
LDRLPEPGFGPDTGAELQMDLDGNVRDVRGAGESSFAHDFFSGFYSASGRDTMEEEFDVLDGMASDSMVTDAAAAAAADFDNTATAAMMMEDDETPTPLSAACFGLESLGDADGEESSRGAGKMSASAASEASASSNDGGAPPAPAPPAPAAPAPAALLATDSGAAARTLTLFDAAATRGDMSPKDRRACVNAYEFLVHLVHIPVLCDYCGGGQGRGARVLSSKPTRELIALIRDSESAMAPVAAVDLISRALHNNNKVRDSPETLYGAINAAWREHHGLREGLPTYPRCRRNKAALDRLYQRTGEEEEEEED